MTIKSADDTKIVTRKSGDDDDKDDDKMSSRAFFYGFLGCIAIASVVTLVSDPLNPRIGDGALECGDWSAAKLKLYLVDVRLAVLVPSSLVSSYLSLFRLERERERERS